MILLAEFGLVRSTAGYTNIHQTSVKDSMVLIDGTFMRSDTSGPLNNRRLFIN